LRLANSIGAVGGLIFLRWVPSPGVMNYMVGSLNIQTEAHRQWRKNDYAKAWSVLKDLDPLLATVGYRSRARLPIDDVGFESELLADVVLQEPLYLSDLTENDRFFVQIADCLQLI